MTDLALRLNTGALIPALGLGTWQAQPGEVASAVAHAIQVGYRHIDCAYCYGNEEEVGEGLRRGMAAKGLKREDVFITAKLWCTYHTRVEQNLDMTLKALGLEYVDLYLMHWPVAMNPSGNHDKFPKLPNGDRDIDWSRKHVDTYRDMEDLLETAKTKAIGVSNYSVKYLDELLQSARVLPAVNQIENHPLLPQQDIVDWCKQHGVQVVAYSPLGSSGSPLLSHESVQAIARELRVTPSTVLLSYHVSRGHSVLAKSVNNTRIEQNKQIVALDETQLDKLSQIHKDGIVRFIYPEFGVDFGFADKHDTHNGLPLLAH